MTLRAVWELERECMCVCVCVKLFDFVFRKRSKWSTQESSSCTIWKPNTYLPWFVCIIIPKLVNSNSPYADQVCLNSSFNLCFFCILNAHWMHSMQCSPSISDLKYLWQKTWERKRAKQIAASHTNQRESFFANIWWLFHVNFYFTKYTKQFRNSRNSQSKNGNDRIISIAFLVVVIDPCAYMCTCIVYVCACNFLISVCCVL